MEKIPDWQLWKIKASLNPECRCGRVRINAKCLPEIQRNHCQSFDGGWALCPSTYPRVLHRHKYQLVLRCLKVSCALAFLYATFIAEPFCQGECRVGERERRPNQGGLFSLSSHWSHQTGCQQFPVTEMDVNPDWMCLERVSTVSSFYRDDFALWRRKLSFDLKPWDLGSLCFQALGLNTSPVRSWLVPI